MGTVTRGLIDPLTGTAGAGLLKVARWLNEKKVRITADDQDPRRRPHWFFRCVEKLEFHVWPFDIAGRGLLFDAIGARLAKAGVPAAAAMMLPFETLVANLRFSAPQLATTAPTQYQEYDRLQSEAEFRVAATPPLIALAFVVPLSVPRGVLVIASIIVAIILWAQAISSKRSAMNVLANGAYLDHVKFPNLEGLATDLEALEKRPETVGAWVGEMIIALDRIGSYEAATQLAEEASMLDQLADQDDVLNALPSDSPYRWPIEGPAISGMRVSHTS